MGSALMIAVHLPVFPDTGGCDYREKNAFFKYQHHRSDSIKYFAFCRPGLLPAIISCSNPTYRIVMSDSMYISVKLQGMRIFRYCAITRLMSNWLIFHNSVEYWTNLF